MIVAAALILAGAGSLALTAWELRKAPEGFEDDHGFHIVHQDRGSRRGRAKAASITTAKHAPLRIRHVFL